jgi:putative lipoic acid-binding regulatory protein
MGRHDERASSDSDDFDGDNDGTGETQDNGRAEKSDEWWVQFRELLEEEMDWPTTYTFKFITPQDGLDDLKEIFEGHPVKVRSSSKGNYVSVTARLEMDSSDEVLAVYDRAYEIDDVIAL